VDIDPNDTLLTGCGYNLAVTGEPAPSQNMDDGSTSELQDYSKATRKAARREQEITEIGT